ncbi:hypothetical protein GA0074692_0056 [Micromonospora pallida]|uniref:Uncharacterized protein n=1 Tax=Micromonospora pallida TaxID=145854 RepID=A0A1C6RIH6_9ACTN|nr:hypothetical protein GA0074692_0056 [Micromonospora pallida]
MLAATGRTGVAPTWPTTRASPPTRPRSSRAASPARRRTPSRTGGCRQYAHGSTGPAFRLGRPDHPRPERAVKLGETMLAPQQLARLVGETVQRSATPTTARSSGCTCAGQRPRPAGRQSWRSTDPHRAEGVGHRPHPARRPAALHPRHVPEDVDPCRPVIHADYVLLDEAQDSNPAVAGLVSRQPAQRILVATARRPSTAGGRDRRHGQLRRPPLPAQPVLPVRAGGRRGGEQVAVPAGNAAAADRVRPDPVRSAR